METPVVLLGTKDGAVAVVGLYETAELAREHVHLGKAPGGVNYTIITPAMNSCHLSFGMIEERQPYRRLYL